MNAKKQIKISNTRRPIRIRIRAFFLTLFRLFLEEVFKAARILLGKNVLICVREVSKNDKNPYDPKQRACRLDISYKNDSDVGYFNWSEKNGYQHRYSACWEKPCSNSNNHKIVIIDVTK